MKAFQTWIMPENKILGSKDKWIGPELVEAKSRKDVVETMQKKNKPGTFKIRLM